MSERETPCAICSWEAASGCAIAMACAASSPLYKAVETENV